MKNKNEKKDIPHILIVDDNPNNLTFLLDILDDKQYETRIARDGKSALEIVRYEPLDLILLDIMMPGMNGFEVCAKLKADKSTKDIPVIFMSALNETVNKVRGLELGAVDYITKPIQVEEVMARIKIHLKLRQLMQREKEVSDLRSYFISMASHDLRSPLNTVIAAAYMLRQVDIDMTDEDRENKLDLIERSAQRTIDILDNILTLNKITTTSASLFQEKLNYPDLCREIVTEFSIIYQQSHDIRFICEDTDIEIRVDPKMIWQILYNLVNNSLKYSPTGASIRISVFRENHEIVTQISDEGIGILESDRRMIFDPHYRGENVGSAKGSGLGLSIVHHLVTLHKGRITIGSGSEKGTVVSVYLPAD